MKDYGTYLTLYCARRVAKLIAILHPANSLFSCILAVSIATVLACMLKYMPIGVEVSRGVLVHFCHIAILAVENKVAPLTENNLGLTT